MAKTWRDRYSGKGVCDFEQNYRFFFKWLLSIVESCFIIRGKARGDTVNKTYLKTHLILDGVMCFKDFAGSLYAVTGGLGGQPDECYIPVNWIVANPVLGSAVCNWRDFRDLKKDCVLIANTEIDKIYAGVLECGLYSLIHQTAVLLADNIVSINCAQINTRVQNFFTADSETQAQAGEVILKEMYAGAPFKILRSDLVEKLQVSPVSSASAVGYIQQQIELHNYLFANFLQSVGIQANNTMKRERLITGEIDTQNGICAVSISSMLESWQRGFDEVNSFFADYIEEPFAVELNPAIAQNLLQPITSAAADGEQPEEQPPEEPAQETPEPADDNQSEGPAEEEAEQPAEPEPEESTGEQLEEIAEAVEAVTEFLTADETEGSEDNAANDEDTGVSEQAPSESDL
ncbi:MAG: hypothetical protein J6S05_07515 [Bacteroidaceae bacterium]|nr:hypothetical protein [Bacteroidaceae bacterium]